MLRPPALAAAVLLAAPALAQDMTPDSVDVIEAASANENLEAFLEAALAAEIAETLATTPDITVFAPINEAFEAVDDLDALLADPAALAEVLELHVVPSVLLSGDLAEGTTELETLGGEILTVTIEEGQVAVSTPSGSEAMVVEADIEADNGVVHAINAVLLP